METSIPNKPQWVDRYLVQYVPESNLTTVSAEDYISPRAVAALQAAYPEAVVTVYSDIYLVTFPGRIDYEQAANKVRALDA